MDWRIRCCGSDQSTYLGYLDIFGGEISLGLCFVGRLLRGSAPDRRQ